MENDRSVVIGGFECISYGTRVFESDEEWVRRGVKERQVSLAYKSAEFSKLVNEVLGTNFTTRTPIVVNAGLGLYPALSKAHGNHSHDSANVENMNDAGTTMGPTPTIILLVDYLVVTNFVRNTWGKYGLVKSMLNLYTRIFSFRFSFIDGLDAMLENVSWFIRNNPLFLKKWNPDVIKLKEDVGKVLGMSSYTRALIDVQVHVELKDNIMVVMPKLVGKRFYTCTVHVEYEWKPLRCACCKVFGHVQDVCPRNIDSDLVKNMKKPSQVPRGVPVGPKVTLVDDKGKPLTKVDSSVDHDIEDEVTSVDNKIENFMASKKVSYGTNSLFEQWKETYANDDYDFNPYDDDMYEGQDNPDKIQAI
nr:hypothetical protein [Tanacetum cinerariifolium]